MVLDFDPIERRRLLDGGSGYRRMLAYDFDEYRAERVLGNVAPHFVNMAVPCLLVGYDEPARQLLEMCFRFLTAAIAENEKPHDYLPGWTEGSRLETLAMCNWLLHGRHDAVSLKGHVRHINRFLNENPDQRDRVGVAMKLVRFVDAGAYQDALDQWAAARGKPPASLGAIRGEGQMACAICRQRLGLEYTAEDVQATLEKFLKRSVGTWLREARFTNAARWMKIAHWHRGKGSLTPTETVLKCYDYLPRVTPPPPVSDSTGAKRK